MVGDIIDQLDNINHSKPNTVDTTIMITKSVEAIKTVLKSRHADHRKHGIETHNGRINFACPYCGDSSRTPSKKRGNLYTDGMWYKCYNAPCVSLPFHQFIVDFMLDGMFTSDELSLIASSVSVNISRNGTIGNVGRYHDLYDYLQLSQYAIPRRDIMSVMGLQEIKGSYGEQYATSRVLMPSIYGDYNHLAYDPKNHALVIMNLTRNRNAVIGIQKRMINAKKGQFRFMSYTFEQLMADFFGVDITKFDDTLRTMISKITLLYNFFNVDFDSKILILESGIDANHLRNSLGILSASVSVNLKDNGYYMYDNSILDDTGKRMAISMLEKGYNVFKWTEFTDNFNQFAGCKDLNDIFKIRDVPSHVLFDYFTNDTLDMMLI